MARTAPTALSRFWALFSGNAQRQHVEQGATAVQVIGDDNVVMLAAEAKLHAEFRHRRTAAPRDLRDLLQPELRAIDRVGREEELAALQAWTTTQHRGRDIAVHCVTGQAGAGKTRLAIELCDWAEAADWSAGFVRQAELERFHQHHHASEWRWQRPTLIVIDYAASSGRLLQHCLDELAAGEPATQEPPLRILLLERHADRDTGWWGELVAADAARGPHTLIEAGKPLALGPLLSLQHRRELLEQAIAKAAPLFDPPRSPPTLPPPGADKPFDDALGGAAIEAEPLFLLMAGIVAVDTGAPAALAMGRLGLADRVVAHERRRLEHVADGAAVDPTLLWHLVACVTLQNGCDIDEATTLVEDECRALGERSAPRPDRLIELFRVALPPPQGEGIDAVRPDLIGEAFLLQHLLPPSRQTQAVERAFGRAGLPVIAAVIRTAQDHAEGKASHASVTWLQHLAERTDDPFALIAIAEALPQQTLALREPAAEITRRIVVALAEPAAADPDLLPARAAWVNNLAVRLSELGDREAALAAAREAADLYRALAAQRPDAFRPDLAMSLNNLANMLSELGDREAALAAAREAVDIRRALAAQRPDAFRPDLAGSLNNLANSLSALGDREAALAAAREAVDIRRALAAQRSDAFRPDLAESLNTLANRLSELGDREAALAAAREAADLYRALAAQRPDAFRPYLAGSLNNLANKLSELGDREAALAAAREAADLYRALAAQRPDAFRPDLAMSLNTLANKLSELGDREAALAAAREAADLYRALAAQRPDVFRPDLALSLNTLAILLSELRDREAALVAAREATDLYRALAAQRPDAFRPDLAMSLNTLANRLSELGDREAALAAAREAAGLYRALAVQRPDAFRPYLALSLNTLANRLSELGDREAALAAAREAADLYRALAAQRPGAFRPDLATSLWVLADCLDVIEQREEALAANVEAISELSGPFQRHRRAFADRITAMAREYLRRCEALGREPDQQLLAPIAAALQELQSEGEPGSQ